MKTKIILILALSMIFICPLTWAGDEGNITPGPAKSQSRAGFVLPKEIEKYEAAIKSEIDKKNLQETLDLGIKAIRYNDDNTINSVEYIDGTNVDYTYTYKENGDLESCNMKSGNTGITFLSTTSKGAYSLEDFMVLVRSISTGKNERKVEEKPIVVMKYEGKRADFEKISRNPVKINFKEIEMAVSKVSGLKEKALKEYEANTADYYDKVGGEVIKMSAEVSKKLSAHAVTQQKRRQIIDEAVEVIYKQVKGGNADKRRQEFLAFQKERYEKIITPAVEMCDGRIKDAVEYMKSVVDKVITSNLAVYLNIRKDKIEAIVNLPEISENK